MECCYPYRYVCRFVLARSSPERKYPIGFPHRVNQDDIHDGYYIPGDSLIIPNIWSVLTPFVF